MARLSFDMTYFKPWTSYAEQIDTLIARGLHVADRRWPSIILSASATTRPRPLFHAAAPDLPPVACRQSQIKLAATDESAFVELSRPGTHRPQPLRHGRAGRLGNTMVNWLGKTTGNKKPLSSFPAEAESPRGAVLPGLYAYKIVRQGQEIFSSAKISSQNHRAEKIT